MKSGQINIVNLLKRLKKEEWVRDAHQHEQAACGEYFL